MYVRIDVCLHLKLLFVFDAVRGRNITLICCSNTHTTMAAMALRLSSLN